MPLDPQKIPVGLCHLIPMAEEFGIADDGYRADRLEKATREEMAAIKDAIEQHDDMIDDWLAGPEADGTVFSNEYVAFSALRMAADES